MKMRICAEWGDGNVNYSVYDAYGVVAGDGDGDGVGAAEAYVGPPSRRHRRDHDGDQDGGGGGHRGQHHDGGRDSRWPVASSCDATHTIQDLFSTTASSLAVVSTC